MVGKSRSSEWQKSEYHPCNPNPQIIYLLPYAISGINIRMTNISSSPALLKKGSLGECKSFALCMDFAHALEKRKSDLKVLCLNTEFFTRPHLIVVFNTCSFHRHRMRKDLSGYQIFSFPSWSLSISFIPDRDLSKTAEPVGDLFPTSSTNWENITNSVE